MTILEIGKIVNRTLNDIMKTALKTEMNKCRTLTVMTETQCISVEKGFVIAAGGEGKKLEIKADTVILAARHASENQMKQMHFLGLFKIQI